MHRLSAAKACFLSDSTENTPKPDDLLQALELGQVIQLSFFFTYFSVHNWIRYRIARSLNCLNTFSTEMTLLVIVYSWKAPQRQRTRRTGNMMLFRPWVIARSLVMRWLLFVPSCPFIASRGRQLNVSLRHRINYWYQVHLVHWKKAFSGVISEEPPKHD